MVLWIAWGPIEADRLWWRSEEAGVAATREGLSFTGAEIDLKCVFTRTITQHVLGVDDAQYGKPF